MTDIKALFNLKGNATLTKYEFFGLLEKKGIKTDDPRIKSVLSAFKLAKAPKEEELKIDLQKLQQLTNQNSLISKALGGQTVIPDFENFCHEIEKIYQEVVQIKNGNIATYIPQLARVNDQLFSIAICTIDGQVYEIGDNQPFCLQSTSKPVSYAIALEANGINRLHNHVGKEPSGKSFNELSLNQKGLPHNPLINAGAIMTASLIYPEKDMADRFDFILQKWSELAADTKVNFNNAVYLSERATADRNYALAYFMRENKAFSHDADIHEALELYFQCCSIEVTALQLATVAATFANSGINPFTNKKIFSSSTVQNCLSVMNACGMYDYSGEWAFDVGIPAKSGVSGAIWLVVPGLMGICVYSPKLDIIGNSVRGVAFAQELVKRFNFHNFDAVNIENGSKIDPRRKRYDSKSNELISMIFAAASGDLDEVKRILATGINVNEGDYDGRTALHLAASENKIAVVEYLLDNGASVTVKDRWGGTPLTDAKKAKHHKLAQLLQQSASPVSA